MSKSILSSFSQKWVKVGQKVIGLVNRYLIRNYKEVGQVGQNHLTHFYFIKSLCGMELIISFYSGSGFLEGESEEKRYIR